MTEPPTPATGLPDELVDLLEACSPEQLRQVATFADKLAAYRDEEPAETVAEPEDDRTDGVFIEDAHATVFSVQPSTRAHLEAGDTPLYVAPNGALRGLVDYRVRFPSGNATGNMTSEWSLVDHEIASVRLKQDGETVVEQNGRRAGWFAYARARLPPQR